MKIPTDCAENLAVTMCGGRLKPHVVDGGCDTIRFEGIEDATVNQGAGIDLRDGITAYDGDGNEIEYEVEPSELAPCEVGEFDIEYRASGKGLTMKPTVCGRNKVHAVDCGLDTVVEHRLVTVTQADPPTISGVGETVIGENTDFDPLDGVSAVDDNGNVLEVEYSGKYLQEATGGIASFESEYEDPMHSLKVSLEPIQDLHGYDKPWAGGTGKNILPITLSDGTTSGLNYTVLKDNGGNVLGINLQGTPTATVVEIEVGSMTLTHGVGYKFNGCSYPNSNLRLQLKKRGSSTALAQVYGGTEVGYAPAETAEFFVTFAAILNGKNVNQTIYPMIRLSTDTDDTYEPYSNICPISGRTEVVTQRTGKNLLNPNTSDWVVAPSYRCINDVVPKDVTARLTFTDKDTSVNVSDINFGWVYDDVSTIGGSPQFYNWVLQSGRLNRDMINHSTNTSTSVMCKNLFVYPKTEDVFNRLFARYDIMVELGSSASTFEPYEGNTYTTSLGRTVYGGTLDVVTGELVVDRAYKVFDGSSDEVWRLYTGQRFTINVLDYVSPAASVVDNITASYLETTHKGAQGARIGIISGSDTGRPELMVNLGLNSVDAMRAYLADNPLQVVYPLATPQTYQLTPQEVRTLLGTNNVWADGIYHPLVKRYLKDNSWVGKYVNGVMYYVNNGYGYLHTDTFKDASVSCSHFAVKKFVSKPTDTSTPLADNGLYLTDDGSLYARYDAVEDADPTVSLRNWIAFVTDNNVYLTVPSYGDTASDSLDLTLQYNAPIPQGEAYKYIAQGTYTVTYRAVDQCGNETEVVRNITVGENIPVRRTVLRQDGTLVINELASEYYANNEIYGAITHEYEPYDENNRYIFSSNNDIPWYAERNSITNVAVGEHIYPTSINMWFYNLQNVETWELARLHTENTTSMIRTFAHSDVTNLHLDELDTSNVTTMESMFFTAKSSQPFVALLDTSSCENFSSMFSNGASSGFTQIDVSSFDVSNAKNMVGMFFRCDRLTELDLSNFIPLKCEDFSNMFSNCTNLEHLNLLNFHTPSAINMEGMFSQCKHLEELDLSAFDTSNVVNMAGMFAGTVIHDAVDFTGFDTSNVDNFTAMFAQASVGGDEHYLDLSTWDTSSAVNMNQMFVTASIETLNIANFTTPNVTNMNLMFANSSSQMLQTIYCNNDFDLTNAGNNVQMFGNNPNLVGGNGTTYDASHTTSEYARLDNPPSAPGYFTVAPDSDITNEEDIELTNEDDEPITT